MGAATTVLVTGASGFLGSRTVNEFAERGYRVVGVDRTTRESRCTEQYALDLPSPRLAEILATERPYAVVHTAGPASVAGSMVEPTADFSGTVDVLFALLDAVRLASPESRIVTVSSAAVYGNPVSLPISESATLAPVSPYGFHKQIAEGLLAEFHRVYGLNTCAARVFSAYGRGLRRQLLWDVCEKATSGLPVRLFGTGDETRDFVHAADVALALVVLAERADMRGDVYNVASGIETPIRELATAVASAVAPDATVEFSGELRAGDPLRWRADIARIQALGFSPQVTLSDGLADYAEWYLESGLER